MRFKKIGIALFVCLALASGTMNASAANKHGTSSLLFTTTLLGSEVEMSAEGVDCLERAGSVNAATIDNTTKAGHSEGVLTFTGVKVLKPTQCTMGNAGKAGSGEITTEAVTDEVIMDPTVGSTVVFDRFVPEVAGGAFATIEFGGAECSLTEASAPIRGSACGESVHTNAGGTGLNRTKQGH